MTITLNISAGNYPVPSFIPIFAPENEMVFRRGLTP